MQIEHRSGGVLALDGRLDALTARQLEHELDATIREGRHTVRLDFSAVAYMSSAGIRTLVKYGREFARLGGSFGLIGIPEGVRSVLSMTGLLASLESSGSADPADAGQKRVAGLCGEAFSREGVPPMIASILGSAEGWLDAAADKSVSMAMTPDTLALGIGVLGGAEGLGRAGEFLALGGAAAYQPADGSRVPDYMVAEGAFIPTVTALAACRVEGAFAHCVRFTPDGGESIALSALLRAALELGKSDTVAVALAAESRGLVGATLQCAGKDRAFFAHPQVRERLAFTADPAHDHTLALVVGVAMRTTAQTPAFLRPAGEGISAHLHAAVFRYQALPRGDIAAADTAQALFGTQEPLAILHLLADDRPEGGAGESHFSRGVLWAGAATFA